jgi:uncharacterized protein
MILNGKHNITAPAQTIWNLMMDPITLARITPAITSLEKTGEDQYKAIANVSIGPVKGEFVGTLLVKDKNEFESFTLVIQQNSKMGNASAEMKMKLIPDGDATEVSFVGDVKLSGMLSVMGGRVLVPVAHMLSKQFFEALQGEV